MYKVLRVSKYVHMTTPYTLIGGVVALNLATVSTI